MEEVFFDNTVCNDHVQQKVIEVSVWGDDFQLEKWERRKLRQAKEDSDSGIEDEEFERQEIRKDRAKIKELLKIIKSKGLQLQTTEKDGLKILYDLFDKDNSDELELNEFIEMTSSEHL